MEIIFAISYLTLFVVAMSVIASNIYSKHVEFEREKFHIDNFGAYAGVLDYHMNKAYEIIYKDRILIYSLEATKIDDTQFEEASKAFLVLTRDMLGDTILKYLIKLYGSDDRLYFIMAEYFNNRFENDEIRKDSQRNLMESEIDDDAGVI